MAAATAQGYKTTNTVGQENFALIDNQTPINPPDIDVEVLDPSDNVRPIYYQFNLSFDQRLPEKSFLKNSLLEVAFVGSESRSLPTYNSGGVTQGLRAVDTSSATDAAIQPVRSIAARFVQA